MKKRCFFIWLVLLFAVSLYHNNKANNKPLKNNIMKTYPTNAERKAAKAAKAKASAAAFSGISTTAAQRAAMSFEGEKEIEVSDYSELVKCQNHFDQQLENQKRLLK